MLGADTLKVAQTANFSMGLRVTFIMHQRVTVNVEQRLNVGGRHPEGGSNSNF